jgi:hypothetical protein
LAGHIHGDDAQVDADSLLDAGDNNSQARALDSLKAPEKENNKALILRHDLQRQKEKSDDNKNRDNKRS